MSEIKELVIYKLQNEHGNDGIQNIVCKIIEKSYAAKKRCLLLCNSEAEVELFDSKLWTYSKLSFIPHGSKYSVDNNDAIHCKIWISDSVVYINSPDYLINLGHAVFNNFNMNNAQKQFERIIDITCDVNDNIETVKNKYNVNFAKCTLWIQTNNKWVKSN